MRYLILFLLFPLWSFSQERLVDSIGGVLSAKVWDVTGKEPCIGTGAIDTVLKSTFDCGTPITNCGDPVNYEGVSYPTVQIGAQCWFAKNLNVGIKISSSLSQFKDPRLTKYCYADVDSYCDQYGGLYQLFETLQLNYQDTLDFYINRYQGTYYDGTKGICPTGWHVPSDSDFDLLHDYVANYEFDPLGGGLEGYRLKSVYDWNSDGGGGGTDSFGFTILPAGYFINPGDPMIGGEGFMELHDNSIFWTTTIMDNYVIYGLNHVDFHTWGATYTSSQLLDNFAINGALAQGHSVRCIKD